jgi:polar amino acid transport system permease protein
MTSSTLSQPDAGQPSGVAGGRVRRSPMPQGRGWSGLSKRRRAQLRRWALYAVTLALLVLILGRLDWPHIQDSMFNPEIVREQFPDIITEAAVNTLTITAYGFTMALGAGLVLALMRLSSIRPYRWFATFYIELFRGLPALVVILFVGFGMPIALDFRVADSRQVTGGVALAIVFSAYIAEIIRAGVQAVPKGQMEAARSLGMSYPRAMISIVVPQAFRTMVPPLTNELVMLLKDTSLLAILGVQLGEKELMKFGRDGINATSNATPLMVSAAFYLVLTIPLTRLAGLLEKHWSRSR